MKINAFEVENVKRVKIVAYEPTSNGLTIIGGNNNQGKSSVLDAIAWALGGAKFAPTNAKRDDSVLPPYIKITLDNGLVVERKGENSTLVVTDPTGKRSGQTLLNAFIEPLALQLPKFLNSSDKEKADILLKIIGVGDQLKQYDDKITALVNRRRAQYDVMQGKIKYAEELPSYPDAPLTPVSATELLQKSAAILAHNGDNQRKRNALKEYENSKPMMEQELTAIRTQITALEEKYQKRYQEYTELLEKIEIGQKTVEELVDESTDELTAQIHDIDSINAMVRANLQKEHAQEEAETERGKYAQYSNQIDELRTERTKLLEGADLPLPGLSVEDGILLYNGKAWDSISGSDQLIVATSIVRKLNPKCEFVLMDKLEQMDLDTLNAFNEWLKGEGLQVIATRVSQGNECDLIIEDGMVQQEADEYVKPLKDWRNE